MNNAVLHNRHFFCFFSIAILLSLCPAWGQESKVIVLHYADSLQGRVIDGEDARELIGHVRISQGNVVIECDHALQFVERGQVLLTGNVVVRDENTTMRAPRGLYHRDARRAEAFDSVSLDDGKVRLTAGYGEYRVEPRIGFFRGRVKIVDSASTVTSDSLTYFRNRRQSLAEGRVKIVNETDHVIMTGGRLEHDAGTQYSRMEIDPLLLQIDSLSPGETDTLAVRSLVMEAHRDSLNQRFVALDSVHMVRSDLAGMAGFAEFFVEGDSMLLRRSPVVWYRDTQISGDSMNVRLSKRKLRRVDVMGNAGAISRSDSLYPDRLDQMVGETMRLSFGDTALNRIDVETRAISIYHLYEDSLANGLNKISGDRIIMHFAGGKVNQIRILGGVEGQYVPENLAKNREQEYALPGLTWRIDRPRLVHRAGRATIIRN